MKTKDLEKLLKSGFGKAAPDVFGSMAAQCCEQGGSALVMTETKKRRPVLKAALIAAAVVAALSITVAAVSFTGLIDERTAFVAAYNHLCETAEGQEKKDVANLILAGMPIEDAAELENADIGLKGLRPVYNLTFTMVETVYHYTVDAKTAVIISSWSEPLEVVNDIEPVYERHPFVISEAEKNANYNRTYALNAVQDHFGCFSRSFPGVEGGTAVNFFNDIYSSEDGYYDIMYCGAGYKYSCKVDMTTGEIYDDMIEKDELYTGEEQDRIKVEPLDGVIGFNAALKAACEAFGREYTEKYCGDVYLGYVEYYDAGNFSAFIPYNSATYRVTLSDPEKEELRFRYNVFVDAVSGEVLSVTTMDTTSGDVDEVYGNQNRGQLAIYAVRDRFGLTDWPTQDELPGEYLYGSAELNLDGTFLVAIQYDGYIYRCNVDPETFAIISEKIEEDPMAEERTLHDGDPDMIGQVKAVQIVAEDIGVDMFDPELYFMSTCEIWNDGRKVYHTYFNRRGSIQNAFDSYYIDCYTGEIISKFNPTDQSQKAQLNDGSGVIMGNDPTKPYDPNQIPSTEANDGDISEAAAVIAALEDIGATEENVLGLKIERDGGEFVVTFYVSDIETVYRVNAKSGKITEKSGATSDMMISDDEAINAVLNELRLKRKVVWDLTAERKNHYSNLLYEINYKYLGRSYSAQVDALRGTLWTATTPQDVQIADLDVPYNEEDFVNIALKQLKADDYDSYTAAVSYRDADGNGNGVRLRPTVKVTIKTGEEEKTCEIDAMSGEVVGN